MSEDDWEPNELRVDALDRIRRGDTSGWFDLCAAEHALGRSRPADRAATRAASAGDPQGWFVTAQIAWSRGNVRRARARLTRADHGDPMVRALDAVLRAEAGVGVSEEERTRAREWFDLTCTLLVTCAVEHVGYVVGGHGLGLELSAGQSDGDVLQGA